QLPRLSPVGFRESGGVRSRSMENRLATRSQLHPLRYCIQPALPGPRIGTGDDEGRSTGDAEALRLLFIGCAYPLDSQSRTLLDGPPNEPIWSTPAQVAALRA